MGSTLDLKSSKILQQIQIHHNSREARNVFQSCLPSYTSKSIPSTTPDLVLDIEAVMKIPFLNTPGFMDTFLGITVWDESKFSVSMFCPLGTVWGTYESLVSAFHSFIILATFCFGSDMAVLETKLNGLISDRTVREICMDCPLYLCYLIDYILRQLWIACRGPVLIKNKVFVMGHTGWQTYLQEHLLDTIELNTLRVMKFTHEIVPTLHPVFTNPLSLLKDTKKNFDHEVPVRSDNIVAKKGTSSVTNQSSHINATVI